MEWSNYFQQVEREYTAQRNVLVSRYKSRGGNATSSTTSMSSSSLTTTTAAVAKGQWKSAEKQSRLIHTAPVLTPETLGGSGNSTTH